MRSVIPWHREMELAQWAVPNTNIILHFVIFLPIELAKFVKVFFKKKLSHVCFLKSVLRTKCSVFDLGNKFTNPKQSKKKKSIPIGLPQKFLVELLCLRLWTLSDYFHVCLWVTLGVFLHLFSWAPLFIVICHKKLLG